MEVFKEMSEKHATSFQLLNSEHSMNIDIK